MRVAQKQVRGVNHDDSRCLINKLKFDLVEVGVESRQTFKQPELSRNRVHQTCSQDFPLSSDSH